jgi:cytochrome c-type biogenesis protein CcmH
VTRLLALVVVLVLATGCPALAAPPSATDLEAEIVCPVCKTTLDQSNAEIAQRMKAYIRQRIAEGATERQIKDELVDQFGRAVLAEPPRKGFDLLAWALPIGGAVLGALVVGGVAWSWARRGRAVPDEPALDVEAEHRVDAALEEFDG